MDIPKRYRKANFADWDPSSDVACLMQDFLGSKFADYIEEGRAPFLVGLAGTGKTHAAATIYNIIKNGASHNYHMSWFSASEVFNQLMDAKDLHMTELYPNLKTALRGSDILFLDDISTLRNYSRLLELFWSVLEHRYSEQLPTVMTANFDVGNGDLWASLENAFTPAISRRIKETASGLTLLF